MKPIRQTLKKIFCGVLGVLLSASFLPSSIAAAATVTTFDHIDIRSGASFSYKVNGVNQTVNINFQDNNGVALNNIKLYRENLDGTRTQIPTTNGRWQSSGQGEMEYRVPGTYPRFYEGSQTVSNEVKYFAEYYLNVTIAGRPQTLIYTSEKYTYSDTKINLCPGYGSNRGIDMKFSGSVLTEYFSPALEIIKTIEGSVTPGTFNFAISNGNNIQISTSLNNGTNSGSVITGGFTAGETYTINEVAAPGYMIKEVKIDGQTATANNGRYSFVADPRGGTTTIEFINVKNVSVPVEKKWAQGAPVANSVTMELIADSVRTGQTLTLTAGSNWKGAFNDLLKYDLVDGHEITYAVDEIKIGDAELTNGALIVYENNGAIAGRYNSNISGTTVTNTWTPATETEDATTTSLTIRKTDMEGAGLIGAEFTLTKGDDVKTAVMSDDVYTFTDLTEGVYTLKETKAPVDYALTETPIRVEIQRERQFVSSHPLTLINVYHNKFTVLVTDTSNYGYKNGVLTIKNTLEVVDVNVSKVWSDANKTAQSIKVQLYKNGDAVDGAVLTLDADQNWEGSFKGLRKTENGVDIEYTVAETFIFGADSGFIVYGTEQTANGEKTEVMGKWSPEVKSSGERAWTVTNTWVAATHKFVGSPTFYIQKVDENGDSIRVEGVKFKVAGDNGYEKEYVTDAEGKIEIKDLPTNVNVWNDGYVYTITEVEAAFGYELVAGSARLEISGSRGGLADVNGLENIFMKEFTFTASGSDDYGWDGINTFLVTNYKTPQEEDDPCKVYGCGGVDVLPKAPQTGSPTKPAVSGAVISSASASNILLATIEATAIITLAGAAIFAKRR